MRRLTPSRVMATTGVIAVSSALVFSVIGIAIFGQDMVPNLLAELAGVSLEIGIAILVIERVTAAHRKQQWSSAYSALSDRGAMTFVDVMRLLSVRSSEAGLAADGDRYDEFYNLLKLHLAEFRSCIEGFSTFLDPEAHEALRRVDGYLSWAASKVADKPTRPAGRLEFAQTMAEAATALDEFLKSFGGETYRSEIAAVEAALSVARESHSPHKSAQSADTLPLRYAAQTELLHSREASRPGPRGIWYDANKELAIGYFLIDHHLLTHISAGQ